MSQTEEDKDKIIALQRDKITLLEKKIDHLIRIIYGSKSEKIDPAQLELLLNPDASKKPDAASDEEDVPAAENIQDLKAELKPVREQKPRAPRLPANLPTIEELIIPDEVRAQPENYRRIGERISERLDVEPGRYTRRLIIRPTFIKKGEPIPSIHTAPLPPTILEGSILTPSLLAHTITSKYCDHLPLHRQEQIMSRRFGINIPRNTLSHWMEVGADRLQPLWNLLAADLRTSSYIKADETPIDYLSPGHGSTKQGYLWLYENPEKHTILYDWQTNRSSTSLDAILKEKDGTTFRGILQSDGHSAYNKWATDNQDIIQAGCWAHLRRKFYDHLQEDPILTAKILRHIQKLYQIEKKYKNSAPEARRHYRRRKSRPLTKKLHHLITQVRKKHLPKSGLGNAAGYALNQWSKLIVYLHHGEVAIDNNTVERAVRPTKTGGKNWLFIGGEETGWRSAVLYTLIENCRILDKDPYAYLKWVFEKLPSMTNQDDLHALLPASWIEKQEEENQAAA